MVFCNLAICGFVDSVFAIYDIWYYAILGVLGFWFLICWFLGFWFPEIHSLLILGILDLWFYILGFTIFEICHFWIYWISILAILDFVVCWTFDFGDFEFIISYFMIFDFFAIFHFWIYWILIWGILGFVFCWDFDFGDFWFMDFAFGAFGQFFCPTERGGPRFCVVLEGFGMLFPCRHIRLGVLY